MSPLTIRKYYRNGNTRNLILLPRLELHLQIYTVREEINAPVTGLYQSDLNSNQNNSAVAPY